jgi:hypothetical protein
MRRFVCNALECRVWLSGDRYLNLHLLFLLSQGPIGAEFTDGPMGFNIHKFNPFTILHVHGSINHAVGPICCNSHGPIGTLFTDGPMGH